MICAAQLPTPGPELQRLNMFVGNWDTEGTFCADGEKADDTLSCPLCPLRTAYLRLAEPGPYTVSRNTAAFSLID